MYKQKNGQIFSIFIALFLSTLDTSIATMAIKDISIYFGTQLDETGLLITSYLLAIIIFLIPAGVLGDSCGKKKCLIAGYFIFLLSSILAGLCFELYQLIICRFIQGIGAALLQSNALGIAADQNKSQHLRYSTYMMLAISMGPILGPVIAGNIIYFLNWRNLFFINIPFCFLGIFLIFKYTDISTVTKKIEFDYKGFLLISLCILLLITAVHILTINIYITIAVICCDLYIFILFIKDQKNKNYPFIPVRSYNKKNIVIFLGALVFGYTTGVLFTISPIILMNELKLTYSEISFLCIFSSLGLLVSTLIRKNLSLCINEFYAMKYGLIILLISYLLFFYFDLSRLLFVLSTFIYGIGGGWFQNANMKLNMNINKIYNATNGSILRLSQNIGIMLGSYITLFILEKLNIYVISEYNIALILATITTILYLIILTSIRNENNSSS